MRGDSRRSIRGAAGTDGVTRRGDSKRSTRVEGLDGRLKPGGAVGCGVGERVGSARGAVAVAESSGEDRGVQLIARLQLDLREEGLYWIDVLLDGSLVTRVPFRVIYQRITQSSSAPQGAA